MDWKSFLEDMSDRLRLTSEQRKVFLARLADDNFEKSDAQIATQLRMGVSALKKHMSEIYDRSGQEFPSLAKIEGRGKLRELRACLKESCKESASNQKLKQEINAQIPPELEGLESKSSLQTTQKSPLKAGAPFPRVRSQENFVERPDALNAVKAKLLAEDERTLVVSAIAGLGGLGKTVLAEVLVQDLEVQARFADGILWVTLGQSPDLQKFLANWIHELDKSREDPSANTLESASRYLHNLLAERQMLLVVDDVWNAAHAEWFRVGGEGCRVLVTTREAQIEGADYYSLELMSEPEAIALVRQKLGTKWRSAQEVEVKAFAKLLGYLPLALDLATNQVRDGLSWEELRAEFEAERRSVASGIGRRSRALNLLDSSEKWDDLDENAQRKCSLQACFNFSLKRLNHDQLQQFAWLGVLPEDVNLNSRMAEVLWDLKPLQAKKVLIMLRNRSFLTDGVATIAEEPTYRVHDLMHDMARSLIEEGILSSEPVPPLELAHRQFLERYRERAANRSWDGLPNDGYIHHHLTWHLEQANWDDELHALMSMSDSQGRNAWFEVCDRLGQPAIFVDDVARGWKIAERGYEGDRAGSIVLQWRYALITATLKSLVENLPISMMAEFVKQGFWTVVQAWAYVEQMQDERKISAAIQALAPYLSKSLFQVTLAAAREIKHEYFRASALSALAKIDSAYFEECLEVARTIKNEYKRAEVLRELTKIDSAHFEELLDTAKTIKNEYCRAEVLRELTKIDSAYFEELLDAAMGIKDKYKRTTVLSEMAKIDSAYFDVLLEAAMGINDEYCRAEVLRELTKIDSAYFDVLLEAAMGINDESSRAMVLSEMAKIDSTYFDVLLEAAMGINDEYYRAEVLSELAKIDSAYFEECLEVAMEIKDKYKRTMVLSEMAKIDSAYFEEALDLAYFEEAINSFEEAINSAYFEFEEAKIDSTHFEEAKIDSTHFEEAKIDSIHFEEDLETTRKIKDESIWAMVLSEMAKIDSTHFEEALQVARGVRDKYIRASVLSALAKIDSTHFEEAFKAANDIRDEYSRASVLSELAKIDSTYLEKLLEAARDIRDADFRAILLSELAKIDSTHFEEAFKAAKDVRDEYSRATLLSELAKIDSACLEMLLEAAWDIRNNYTRAMLLSELAKINSTYFKEALQAARDTKNKYNRAWVLSALAKIDSTHFEEALQAAKDVRDKYSRAILLSELAKINSTYFEMLGHRQTMVWKELAKIDSSYTNRLSPPYSEWQTHLHILAHRKRSDLMQDLVTLHPAILHLGGTAAVRGVIDAMRQVCSQWK
jgi:glycerol-3-phosphate cytidylyltransferase-like family protein